MTYELNTLLARALAAENKLDELRHAAKNLCATAYTVIADEEEGPDRGTHEHQCVESLALADLRKLVMEDPE